MIHRSLAGVCIVALVAIVGCEGAPRLTGAGWTEPTEDGLWHADGSLIRVYEGVTMRQAFGAIVDMARDQKWEIEDREVGARRAELDIETSDGDELEFEIYSTPGQPLEVALEFNGGDRFRSAEVLDALEKRLEVKRLR